jgi:uroporphyrinogen decarboxylase
MNERERFLATMHYQPRDRAPICDFGFWDETIQEWHKEGLPESVVGGHDSGPDSLTTKYFGMDVYAGGGGLNTGLCPAFEYRVIEDQGDHEIVQQYDGVTVRRKKYMGSIPEHHGHLLTDRASWEKHYKPRLDPDAAGRFSNLEDAKKVWQDDDYPYPKVASGGSLFGWIRDWMGMENVSYLVYDEPELFEEMVETITDCIVETNRRAFENGARYDGVSMWEDMCYNSGPLLSPSIFKKVLVPQYKRISELFNKNGTGIIWIDCDGKIDELIPMWLEAGINCMFPIEVGTWDGNPVRFRKEYGKDLLLMGGFDKHILARTKGEIVAEILRLTPLVEEGGFIPFCDHRVPPDVPLENYLFYLDTARRVWGKNSNLKPVEWSVS